MNKPIIGTKVKLKRKTATWYLNNPDIFVQPSGAISKEAQIRMDSIMQLCFMRLLGVPVIGTIESSEYIGAFADINFEVEGISYDAWFDVVKAVSVVKEQVR